MSQIEVVNVVGHLDFRREFALSSVAELLSEDEHVSRTHYEPAENHWLQSWFLSPKEGVERYVAFYRSGTAVATGCSSTEEFDDLANRIVSVMEPAVEKEVLREVKNFVVTADVGTEVELAHLAIKLGFEDVEYEPEQFPGLMYRDPEHDCVFLVFSSGKVVCTGINELSTAESACREFISKAF